MLDYLVYLSSSTKNEEFIEVLKLAFGNLKADVDEGTKLTIYKKMCEAQGLVEYQLQPIMEINEMSKSAVKKEIKKLESEGSIELVKECNTTFIKILL